MAKKTTKSSPSLFDSLKPHKIIPISALVLLFVAVGTASALVSKDQTNRARIQETALPTNLADLLSIDAIKVVALKDSVAGATLTGIQLEQNEGIVVYVARYSDGSFKLFNAKSGVIIIKNSDTANKDAETVPAGFVAGITIDQARVIAQGKFTDKTITKIELETENGIVVYSVRFSDDSRVNVNAKDGTIISARSGAATVKPEDNNTPDDNTPDDQSDDLNNDDTNKSDDSADKQKTEDSSHGDPNDQTNR